MDKDTEFQTGWSSFLMIVIAVMVPVYFAVCAEENERRLMIALLFFPALTVVYTDFLTTTHYLD